MVVFPNCKVNLGLSVISRRADGFHNLETVFYPVGYVDALEMISVDSESTDIKITGTSIPGPSSENLCVRAYNLLRKDFPNLPAVQIHLHKAIPTGSGLGGGSSDGAFALKLLNDKFSLGLEKKQLVEYALELGSDCPFFIHNAPCLASGRGEVLEPIQLDLSGYTLVLIVPGIHVSTSEAFAGITPTFPEKSIGEIIQQPIQTWKESLKNDFEKTVFEKFPSIEVLKMSMYSMGAVYASMSGSGSAVYGLFDNKVFTNDLLSRISPDKTTIIRSFRL